MTKFTQSQVNAINARYEQGREPKPDCCIDRAVARVEREKDLHDAILAYCRQSGWIAFHCRMDKPSHATIGQPDFIICMDDRVVFIEAKSKTGKPTKEQLALHAWMKKLGLVCHIVRSMKEFMEIVK